MNTLQNLEQHYSYLFLFNWYNFLWKRNLSVPPHFHSWWPADQCDLHFHCYFIFTSVYVRANQVNWYLLSIYGELLVTIGATKIGLSLCAQRMIAFRLGNCNNRRNMVKALQKVLVVVEVFRIVRRWILVGRCSIWVESWIKKYVFICLFILAFTLYWVYC